MSQFTIATGDPEFKNQITIFIFPATSRIQVRRCLIQYINGVIYYFFLLHLYNKNESPFLLVTA